MNKLLSFIVCLFIASTSAQATRVGQVFNQPIEEARSKAGVVFDFSVIKTDLAPAASYNYVVTPLIDIVLDITVDGEEDLSFVLYQDPTTAGGSTGVAYNQNHNSSAVATSIVTLTSSPTTVSVTGTAIWSEVVSEGSRTKTLFLDADSDYLIGITNISAATGNVSVGGSFFKITEILAR